MSMTEENRVVLKRGVVTLNEPYETLVPTSLYHVGASFFIHPRSLQLAYILPF